MELAKGLHAMALDTPALLELTETLGSADGGQLMRRLLHTILQALIDAEAIEHICADPHERTEARMTYRNGTREKTVSMTISLKDDPYRILRAIKWLGPYIEPNDSEDPHDPILLGYLRHEYQVRPILVWHRDQMLYGEDLGDE